MKFPYITNPEQVETSRNTDFSGRFRLELKVTALAATLLSCIWHLESLGETGGNDLGEAEHLQNESEASLQTQLETLSEKPGVHQLCTRETRSTELAVAAHHTIPR